MVVSWGTVLAGSDGTSSGGSIVGSAGGGNIRVSSSAVLAVSRQLGGKGSSSVGIVRISSGADSSGSDHAGQSRGGGSSLIHIVSGGAVSAGSSQSGTNSGGSSGGSVRISSSASSWVGGLEDASISSDSHNSVQSIGGGAVLAVSSQCRRDSSVGKVSISSSASSSRLKDTSGHQGRTVNSGGVTVLASGGDSSGDGSSLVGSVDGGNIRVESIAVDSGGQSGGNAGRSSNS